MRQMIAAMAAVALLGPLARGDDKDKPLEGDLKDLQGKWTTRAGPAQTPLTLAFDKGTLTITVVGPTGQERTITGEFTIDDQASPKQMDWTKMKVGTKDLPGRLAIYAFDGKDKLKIASGGDEKTRPTVFVEKPADAQTKANLLVFSRVKDEK